MRKGTLAIYAVLILGNLAAWGWALLAFGGNPLLLGTALLAYGFGLRHAVDADHIAAIDNVTRKLMQEGKRPLAAGFFFSLGHSTVVTLAAIGVAGTTTLLEGRFAALKGAGSLIGTAASVLFLFAIAWMNLLVLGGVWRAFRRARRGHVVEAQALDLLLARRGLLARLFRPMFRLVSVSWHMYPLGFLFGLGFETATEIALLGISADGIAHGVSVWSILVFPALFAAGMSLVDTADSVLMVSAYGWAFMKPLRKLYYNMTITGMSVLVAVLVGGIEGLGLIADQLNLQGEFWDSVGALNDNFGVLGYAMIALFAASWLFSLLIYRWRGYDAIEAGDG